MFQIQGKVALIIGVTRGLGMELARQLLMNQVRAVVIVETNSDIGRMVVQKLQQEFGEKRVVLIQADPTNPQELEGAYASAIKMFNNLDIVINNIGVVDETNIEQSVLNNMCPSIRSTQLAVSSFLPQHKTGTEAVVLNIHPIAALGTIPEVPALTGGWAAGDLTGLTAGFQYERNNVRVITLYIGASPVDLQRGQQWFQQFSSTGLTSQPRLESAGRALINAIESGIDRSSWMATSQPIYDVLQVENQQLQPLLQQQLLQQQLQPQFQQQLLPQLQQLLTQLQQQMLPQIQQQQFPQAQQQLLLQLEQLLSQLPQQMLPLPQVQQQFPQVQQQLLPRLQQLLTQLQQQILPQIQQQQFPQVQQQLQPQIQQLLQQLQQQKLPQQQFPQIQQQFPQVQQLLPRFQQLFPQFQQQQLQQLQQQQGPQRISTPSIW